MNLGQPSPRARLFTICHSHSYENGSTYWLLWAEVLPSEEQVVAALDINFEPENDELIDIEEIEKIEILEPLLQEPSTSQKILVKLQAKLLALEHRQSDEGISKIYWFPDDSEVRILELNSTIPGNCDGSVRPFFYQPEPSRDLPLASSIAIIKPNEFGKLKLPPNWGVWDIAVEL